MQFSDCEKIPNCERTARVPVFEPCRQRRNRESRRRLTKYAGSIVDDKDKDWGGRATSWLKDQWQCDGGACMRRGSRGPDQAPDQGQRAAGAKTVQAGEEHDGADAIDVLTSSNLAASHLAAAVPMVGPAHSLPTAAAVPVSAVSQAVTPCAGANQFAGSVAMPSWMSLPMPRAATATCVPVGISTMGASSAICMPVGIGATPHRRPSWRAWFKGWFNGWFNGFNGYWIQWCAAAGRHACVQPMV